MASPGDNEQPRAGVAPPEAQRSEERREERRADSLEWQAELDTVMSDLDIKLSHPRRRASDAATQPVLPHVSQIDVTNELLDEIAWRVAEQIRRTHGSFAAPAAAVPAPPPDVSTAPRPAMPYGAALVIRLRRPLFSWRFWRRRSRRRQSMISLSDYRVT